LKEEMTVYVVPVERLFFFIFHRECKPKNTTAYPSSPTRHTNEPGERPPPSHQLTLGVARFASADGGTLGRASLATAVGLVLGVVEAQPLDVGSKLAWSAKPFARSIGMAVEKNIPTWFSTSRALK
jgi:hypothetical protein